MADILILSLGDPEERIQVSHVRVLTYRTVSYKIYVALSHDVCSNLLWQQWKTMHRERAMHLERAVTSRSPGAQHPFVHFFLHLVL